MIVNITIPVFNEEMQLRASITTLNKFFKKQCRFNYQIVIANNGSTDRTLEIARELSMEIPELSVLHLQSKGRGLALHTAWSQSKADIFSYMDVDLSSDLNSFPSLIEAVQSGNFDVAVGSRILKPALTTRSLKREFISRCYLLILKSAFRITFSDAQCGFKAISRRAASMLLPLVEDRGWFWDTELLVLADAMGLKIFDLPIRWVDDPDSRVKIFQTALADLKGILRLRRYLARHKEIHNFFTPAKI
ncbi:MAG: glycosyltransferase [Verrucomicrobiota bacterium]|nr:glycosyltransferase [Verrucomicrobiota bacterium]